MKSIGSKRWTVGIVSFLVVFGFLWAVSVPPALADTLSGDPQIFICQLCTAPPGGDPNLITNPGAFNVGVAGNHTLQNPLLIIVGEYNGVGTPTVSFGGNPSVPLATLGTYGLTGNSNVLFNALSVGSAYDQLGLSSGGSESFVNWSGGDVANGFAAPTSFRLYAFTLNVNLTGGSPITIDTTAIPGSYIIGYSCDNGTGSSSGCATNGNIGQTPFTNAGLNVPEPGSLLLLGTGLAGLGLWQWKRRRGAQA